MRVRGPKSIIKENSFGELTAKKWLDSVQKQKRRSSLKECDRQTDRQRDRQTESIVNNNDS